jgi:hypothetical protein
MVGNTYEASHDECGRRPPHEWRDSLKELSLIGANALFHNPGDRGPETVDPSIIARFVAVLTPILKSLANA